jgi:septal ring factor EnvC (AmiA/AmiB activator)
MKLTDLFKKPKKEEAVPPPPASAAMPVDQVSNLKNQGYPNDQIIDYLKSQGFSAAQISDAITQVEARTPAEPFQPPARAPEQGFAPQQRAPAPDNTEEMVEAIVDEKWRNFSKDLTKFKDWQDASDSRFDKLEQGLKDTRADVESLHKAIVSKISDYDKSLMDVGTEIKAMEKVFSKVLPDLTESVSKLSSLSKKAVVQKKKVKK